MDKAEQNQAENTVKNGTAPKASAGNTGKTSGNISGNTAASSPANSPAESASAEATAPDMEAVQVDAVQIDSARLDSTHSVYSTDLDPNDDYEEVVEEYATTDAPDGTHREERRITRTTHHPHGKQGDQKAGTQGNPDGAAEIIDAGEPETHTTTIRTVTRTVTDPPRRAPRTRLFRTLSKYRGEKNLAAWEERSSRPMFVASVLYLLAFAAPIMSTRIQEPYDAYLNIIQMILWGLFAADYCIRLYLAPRRLYFITHNLMNLAIVLLPAWRIVSFLAMIYMTANRQYKRLSELAMKLFGYTAIFIIMFALAIYSVESSEPGAMIRDLPTAYWWTFTTLATVGYGDVYPITGIGRVIAVVVMLYGVGMVAVATGALASWIIEKIGGREEQEYPATKADVDDLRQEISELRALLAREYARREAHDYTLREVVDEDGVHPVPSEAEAARRAGFSAAGFSAADFAAPGASADAPNAAPTEESAESSASHEVAVREQEPVALLEETRQTFTIIREKFSLRSRKQ
ncbi:Ion channel [Rothia mucilaginosa ATCC 25296]|uniref:potassium channel family protein n=1 Tax=Rothia mucilaginosa TaxID=43675 RepID=UPI0001B0F6EE|nr:potassium channel family protein [Rothia mucilaginosa]EET75163.1 Ion channel [Rothia mucilaginosa ATCC 25296]